MAENEPTIGLEIAVIGMAGRFPAAANIDEYWENIKNGIECIQFFSEEELENAGISPEFYNRQDYIKSNGGIVQGVEYFDADFFGYTATEAELLDPQVRLFHECCWEALEDAGYDPSAYNGLIGLFGGAEDNNEWREKVLLSMGEGGAKQTRILLSSKDFVTARVSYKLNLKGPVYAIITGCSTALTSIHLASRSLIGGECDMVLSGGAYVHLLPVAGRIYQAGMLESSDGHLRAFDSRASGTVFSSGAGIVVLKILEEAQADNDHIYAVIKGSSVNCDGNRKVNFTAPSVKGQVDVIRAAYEAADVDMETIAYLETHGTGTPLGDPIEINALKQAFNTRPGWKCPIGSVKTNIGHTDVAAGVASFIKAVLILKHKLIPPSLNFETPNPKLELEKSPFYVNTGLTELKSSGGPRRVAVSSFGFGGTNVHAILEEAPLVSESVSQRVSESVRNAPEGTGGLAPLSNRQQQLILLSAKTPTALEKMTENLVNFLKENPVNPANPIDHGQNRGQNHGLTLADMAYTLQVGRQPFQFRKACVCSNPGEAVHALPSSLQGEASEDPPLVFMFSGQGSQYVNMGEEIYHSEPVFREHMDQGFDILKSLTGKDFKVILYPGPDSPILDEIQQQMDDAHNSGPIKLLFEYSLGKLLIHWGICPHAVMGHSFGEYTAACIAGVFSIRDALELALLRGELMMRTPPGGMMSIPLGQAQLSLALENHPDISLAAVNSSSLCFVSGPTGALEHLEKELKGKGIESMHINFPRAAHSGMMTSITREFEKKVRAVKLQEPTIPFISGLTGDWLALGHITDPGYWAKHLVQPVLFCQGVETLFKEPGCIFVQVGPDKGLPLFVNQHHDLKPGTLVINLVKHKKDNVSDMAYLLQQVGSLWLYGVKIHWPAFYANKRRQRVSLPTYPFERKRYWIDIDISAVVSDFFARDQLKKRKNIIDWLYTSSWKRAPLVPSAARVSRETTPCLIFTDASGVGTGLAAKLIEKGQTVIMVKPGKGYEKENSHVYRINPTEASDYDYLLKALKTQKEIPRLVIHLWNVTGTKAPGLTVPSLENTLDLGFYSLLHLVQSLGRLGIHEEMHLQVVTDNMQSVIGKEVLYPAKAASLGAVWVIPLEYPNISCHTLDIILPEPGSQQEEELLQRLLTVITWGCQDKTTSVIALRGNYTWTQAYEPIPIEKPQGVPSRLKQDGVYLITGGLGGIGYVLAQHLVKTVKARLILTGRTSLPVKDQWQHWLDEHPDKDPVSEKIKKVMYLEKQGAEVLVFNADSADEKQMQEVVSQAVKHFGQVNGIIHTAGLVDYYGVIQNRTREMTENILAPKVKGTVILDQLTRDMPLDFFVICSSIASLIPGFGEVGYAAANIFVDAFAHYKNLTGTTFTTAVNWDTWQEVGAAVESVKRQKQAGKTSYIRLEDGIRSTEGWEIFTKILENPNPQVVVSTKDLHRFLKQYHRVQAEAKKAPEEMAEAAVTVSKRSFRPRPKLSTPYVAPVTPTQQALAEIWQEYFGIDEVGIHDDFFELGGDSLMATIMAARVHKRMNIRIPLTEIFQGPSVELLSQYIKSQGKEEYETIPLAEKKEYYALSSAQKRIHFLQEMELRGTGYNIQEVVVLEAAVDMQRLEETFLKLIQRHESLRTSFEIVNHEPVQRVHEHVPFKIESCGHVESPVHHFVRPFDLTRAPLMRVGLFAGENDRCTLVVDMHHIISDGTSHAILIQDFKTLYSGKALPHISLSLQYKDYSEWQTSEIYKKTKKKQETFWLEEFKGDLPVLDLPTDFPRSPVLNFEGSIFSFEINRKETSALKRLALEEKATLFMVLLAVCNVLLSKICNQENIIVGTPIAGRNHVELERIIGMFVNTLALKSHVNPNFPFNRYLRGVKQKTLGAFLNQDYPFEELVEKVSIDRDSGRNPLFDIMVDLQNMAIVTDNTPNEIPTAAPLNMNPKQPEETEFPLDLIISATEIGEIIIVSMKYYKKLFRETTIRRISGYFMKIATAIAEQPGIPISQIDILPEEEKQQLIDNFNNTRQDYPLGKTIHELFEEQVIKTPGKIAVRAAVDFRDIYEELNSEKTNPNMFARLETCCFIRNTYLFECHFKEFDQDNPFILLKTPQHNIAVVNKNVFKLLDLFDGIKNLASIYNLLRTAEAHLGFLVYAVNIDDVLEISFSYKKKEIFLWDGNFAELTRLVKFLFSINFIRLVNINLDTVDKNDFNLTIPLHGYFEPVKPGIVNPAEAVENIHLLDNLMGYRKNLPEAEVLLLGDTPGQSSAGLLYLASYLKRNGINALCLFNDVFWETASLKKNIEDLLRKVKPRIVGVSMKWFIHIARVLGISKIIKEYSKKNGLDIKVVLGGNSASFFWEDVIKNENVDYIIRGDGELPFLKLCRGETPVPNCVYKKDGKIIANPITYIQTPKNSSDIYLSHMDEVMISHYSCVFGIFFIFTQKGCQKNCHYCGGCNDAQRIAFNRPGLFRRNVPEVRKDIIESKKYTSTFFFLFDDYSNDTLLKYCKEIWEGIDLTRHIGFLSNVILPSPELIEYCNKVFQYVYWNLDMASMSERHRLRLLSENMVKAQPTDRELLEIFDECEKYDNNEIIINFITGLPYFNREDIEASKRMLSHIINKYSCFGEYFWARLHAEPGAPVIADADKYDMYSLASNFEEFYEYSRKSFQEFELYPNVDNFTYPYIYFKDEELNSAVSQYYVDTHHQWLQYKKSKRQKAIVTNELTYRQLNERAHRLAEILKNKGVRPDTIVGIMVERSLDMIVGLLGILKAGGAYLPLDPEYPETRIAYMMEDCQANLLLSQGHLLDRIPFKNNECEIIDLGTIDAISNLSAEPGVNKPVQDGKEKNSLAYIIFTSGSTGKPKGVAIEHRSIVNTLVWRKNHYRFDENDIVLQLPSFSFDSSVEDIFTPLISGSQLLLVQAHQRFDMDYIRELLKTIPVTHFLNVPALYKIYLEEIPEALAGLKHITIAGENFTEELVIRHFQRLPQVRMYNEYGPTENTVCSTAYQFGQDRTRISIGKPINNVRCYILDGSGGLCPIGTTGELCLAGAGISRGYINNPELTDQRFLQASSPFFQMAYAPQGEIIYKTGDLVRWLADSNIEFLGRIDNQVKIRGYRVETGEIANRLLKHAAVDDAVVMVREYNGGEKYLAAYIVTVSKSSTLAAELREYLAAVLPEYMVPAHFITIDSIPLTPGGKIDTRALPDPEAGPSASYTAPSSEIERKLVEIWAEILPGSSESGGRIINIDDNFFQLGGHSLKATVMVSRMHKVFNVKVPMMEIFNWPTVRGLSEYIRRAVGDRFISIKPAEKKSIYVLSAAQRRLYSFQQMNRTSIAYNSPNAYVLAEKIDKEKLELAFKKLIQRHDSLRTSFHLEQNYPGYTAQRIHHWVEFAPAYYEVETKESMEEILEHFAQPFDLSRPPLLRIGLIKTGEGQQVLVYDMHHIITDGTSMEILIREFMTLYAGKELPALRLQYKDYAQWQSSEAWQGTIEKQEEFWLRTFAGEKSVLDLPTDYARPRVQSFEGSALSFTLDKEKMQELNKLAKENESTLFMVVLALFSLLLSRLSGQEDIVIGTGVEGRRHFDLMNIMGMFVNTLAIRTHPGKNKRFGDFLKEVKEVTWAAFENQDYPFETLVEKVQPHRDTGRNPLFDVMIQFQAAADALPPTQSLKVKPQPMKTGTAKFDLTLWGFETEDTLLFYFEYCTRLFKEETIKKMIDYFGCLTASILADPGKQLIKIDMFEKQEEIVQFAGNLEVDETW